MNIKYISIFKKCNAFYKIASITVPELIYKNFSDWLSYIHSNVMNNQDSKELFYFRDTSAPGTQFEKKFTFPISIMPYVNQITDQLLNYRIVSLQKRKKAIVANLIKEKGYSYADALREHSDAVNATVIDNQHLKNIKKVSIDFSIIVGEDVPPFKATFYKNTQINNDTLFLGQIVMHISTNEDKISDFRNSFKGEIARRSNYEVYSKYLNSVLKHELIHAIQFYIVYLKSSRSGGLGKTKTVDLDFTPGGNPDFSLNKMFQNIDWDDESSESEAAKRNKKINERKFQIEDNRLSHPFRDIEFKTRMSDAIIWSFDNIKINTPKSCWKLISKYFTAQIDKNMFINELNLLLNNDIISNDEYNYILSLDDRMLASNSFRSWKELEPEKWKAGVREFYKKVELD